jgi:hypothetical protein
MMAGFTENYVKVYAPYNKAKVNSFERIRFWGDKAKGDEAMRR